MSRRMPHSVSAEQSVLGSVLVRPEVFPLVNVRSEQFFDARCRAVWDAMVELHASGTAIDLATLEDALQRGDRLVAVGGIAFLGELALAVPTAANVEHYAGIVREHALSREVILAASSVVTAGMAGELAGDELLSRLRGLGASLRPATERRAIGARALAEARTRELMASAELAATGENASRILTGIPTLDERLGGLPRGNHCGLVAQTGHGKTATLMHIGFNAPTPTLTFCFEELARDATDRFLSAATGIPGVALASGRIGSKQIASLIEAANNIRTDRYFVDARGMSDADVVRVARQAVPELGVGLVMVDYLNRVKLSASPKERTDERMRHALGLFDDCCGELDVAWLTAAQVNRSPGKENRVPRISDAHECAAMEQYSKVGLVVYRPHLGSTEVADDELWVVIDKANIGGRFTCVCGWHGPTMQLLDAPERDASE